MPQSSRACYNQRITDDDVSEGAESFRVSIESGPNILVGDTSFAEIEIMADDDQFKGVCMCVYLLVTCFEYVQQAQHY